MGLSPQILGAILRAGAQAPSGDNMQPWKFHWNGDGLDVLLDPKRDQSLYNARQLASYIALGAVVENLFLAASVHKLRAEVNYFPAGSSSEVVARLRFLEGGGKADPLAGAIFDRCVNRRPYDPHFGVAAETIASLAKEARPSEGIELSWVTEPTARARLARAAAQGDRLLFENRYIHRHFFSCIRWNQEEAEKTRDGLPFATLELSGFDALVFPKLRNWPLVRLLNYLGLSRAAAMKSAALIRRSSAVGLITVSEPSSPFFIQAGRAFERVWLKATLEKLAFQPMTGFVLLQLRSYLREYEGFNAGQVKLLSSIRDQLSAICGTAGKIPAIMFRIGKAPPPSGRTLRRDVSAVSNVS
ncbi:MAG TPA: hypothetical protein VNL14_23125 [Candidatus Acidoferrales bacterium]|nr:hypothetical protein [Candidatus Acidoferrales bacterium]